MSLPATPASIATTAVSATRRRWLQRLGSVLGGALAVRPALARPSRPAPFGTNGIEPFIGEIMLCAFHFAPRGYALCQGQLLPINQNQLLFAVLGTTYGGDGRTTFALPNLSGATAIGSGQGPGLSSYSPGTMVGNAPTTLTTRQLPAHNHQLPASAAPATSATPAGQVPAVPTAINVHGEPVTVLAYADAPNVPESTAAITAAGGQPIDLHSPYLVLNYCIALQGAFPPRS